MMRTVCRGDTSPITRMRYTPTRGTYTFLAGTGRVGGAMGEEAGDGVQGTERV
jgi:hypothetical protein